MRANVECRRCSCGQIIGLRESCEKCVAAQRARLHADGVCDRETRENPYLTYLERLERKMEPLCGINSVVRGEEPPRPLPPPPVPVVVGIDWGREDRGAIMTGVQHADGTVDVTGHFQIPAIGEVVSWEVAKADMQARPEARYKVDAKGCAGIVYGWQGDRLKFGPTLGYLATTALKHFDSPWTRVA